MSKEDPVVGKIAFGADLVTVQKGTSYYKIHYYFNESDNDVIKKYRNSVSFNYLDPEDENFNYWTIDNKVVSANQFNETGLTSDVSAYMTSISAWTFTTIDDSLETTLINETELENVMQVLEKKGKLLYSNTYPSATIDSPIYDINTVDPTKPKKFQYWLIQDKYGNNKLSANSEQTVQISKNLLSASIVWKDLVNLNINCSDGCDLKYDYFSKGLDKFAYADSILEISAIPAQNWHLSSWSDTTIVDSNRKIYIGDSDLNLTATFAKDIHVLSVHVELQNYGYVDVEGYDTNKYDFLLSNTFDTTVTLSAKTSSPYKFAGWSDGNVKAIRQVQLSEDIDLIANFCVGGINNIYLKANDDTLGKLYQSGIGMYLNGEIVTLSAIPNVGCKFVQWYDERRSLDADKSGNIRKIQPTNNKCYIAEFADDGIVIDDSGNMLVFNIDKEEVSYVTYN